MNELCVNRQMLLDLAPQARLMVNPPGQIPPGALSGERASRQQGRGLNFDSLRRYQPGDDIRMIDWQTTAGDEKRCWRSIIRIPSIAGCS